MLPQRNGCIVINTKSILFFWTTHICRVLVPLCPNQGKAPLLSPPPLPSVCLSLALLKLRKGSCMLSLPAGRCHGGQQAELLSLRLRLRGAPLVLHGWLARAQHGHCIYFLLVRSCVWFWFSFFEFVWGRSAEEVADEWRWCRIDHGI